MTALRGLSGNAQRALNFLPAPGELSAGDARAAVTADRTGANVQILQDRVELSDQALRMAAGK